MSKSPPTQKKLKKAREEGKVCKSALISQSATLIGLLLLLMITGRIVLVRAQMLLQSVVEEGLLGGNVQLATTFFGSVLLWIAIGIAALLLISGMIGCFAEFFQVKFRLSFKQLTLNFTKLDPAAGGKRVAKSIKKGWITVLKLAAVVLVTYLALRGSFEQLYLLIGSEAAMMGGASLLPTMVLKLIGTGIAALCGLSALEYFVERKSFLKELEMSVEEVRREAKEDEGDPLLRALRKALAHEVATESVTKRVRRAKVIIVERA